MRHSIEVFKDGVLVDHSTFITNADTTYTVATEDNDLAGTYSIVYTFTDDNPCMAAVGELSDSYTFELEIQPFNHQP